MFCLQGYAFSCAAWADDFLLLPLLQYPHLVFYEKFGDDMQRIQSFADRFRLQEILTAVHPMDMAALIGCFLAARVTLVYGLSPVCPALLYGFCLKKRWDWMGAIGSILGGILLCPSFPPVLGGVLTAWLALQALRLDWIQTNYASLARILPLVFGAIALVIFSDGTLYTILLGIIVLMLIGVFGPIYGMAFGALQKALRRRRLYEGEQYCLMALVCTSILFLQNITLLGVYLDRTACCLMVLLLAYFRGPIAGGVVGIALGGCAAMVGYSPLIIGGLAICGLCAGMCREMGKLSVAVGFSLSSAVFLLFVQDTGEILLPIMEQTLAGAGLFLVPRQIVGVISRVMDRPKDRERHPTQSASDERGRREIGNLAKAIFLGAKAMEKGNESAQIASQQMGALAVSLNHMAMRETIPLQNTIKRVEAELADGGYGDCPVSAAKDPFDRLTVTVTCRGCGGKRDCVKVIRRYISRAMGQDYILAQRPCRSGQQESCVLQYAPGPRIALEVSTACSTKPGMRQSGDTFLIADVGPAKTAAILCDGMGSGKAAKEESSTAAQLLLAFQRAGLGAKPMIKMVNSIMASRNRDVFSTGDMVVFDLAGKSCEIIKMSAPATFILRQAHAHWISGKSLPMGAVSKATPFYARREVEVGDYVVMVSDGISDCFTSNRELGQWMLGIYQQDPSVDLMSQRILKEAKSIAGHQADDMTVAVIKVKSVV